jgi:hypothetical protein
MEKEQLINNLLAFLAPVINKNEDLNELPSSINILSRNEVQVRETPGHLPTNIVFENIPFAGVLWKLVRYDFESEFNNYLECLSDEGYDTEAEALEDKDIYNPELLPDHIYHSLRYVEEMLLCYERESGDSSFRKMIPYTIHD